MSRIQPIPLFANHDEVANLAWIMVRHVILLRRFPLLDPRSSVGALALALCSLIPIIDI